MGEDGENRKAKKDEMRWWWTGASGLGAAKDKNGLIT